MTDLPEASKLKPVTVAMLASLQDISVDDASALHIYTDGSGMHGEDEYATWAFAVFLCDNSDGQQLVGYQCGPVATKASPSYVGAEIHDSMAAEMSGL
eukprot:10847728-Karenia_brevis.AAC.1